MIYNVSLIGAGPTEGRMMCLPKEAERRAIFFVCNVRKRGYSVALVLLDLVNVVKEINRVEDWSSRTHVSDIDKLVSSFAKISFMHVAIGLLMVLLFGRQLWTIVCSVKYHS